MILHHVAQCTALLVVTTTALDTYCFCNCYLHMVYIIAVPYWLKQRIGKTQRQNVLYGFFSKIMVYAIDLVLIKHLQQQHIQLMRTFQIVAKRFFYHNAGAFGVVTYIKCSKFSCDIRHEL